MVGLNLESCPQEAGPQPSERGFQEDRKVKIPALGKLRNEKIIKKESQTWEAQWDPRTRAPS